VESLLTLFVALTAAAVLVQAGFLVGLYIMTRRVTGQIEATLNQIRDMTPALKVVTENLRTASTDMVEVGAAARQQFHHVEEMVAETGRTLQSQLEKVDRMSQEVSDRVNETVEVVQESIVRPVREVGAIARGVSRGVEILLNRKEKSPVDQARQDEEMFI
jgi:methyl-accepting chemotaxis protein